MANIHSDVQNYYGEQLKQSSDLKTDACCTKVVVPLFIRKILGRIHPDVIAKYYGCGLVVPPKLENCRVVDLGCGSGRDVYIVSNLVGAQGFVVGVDMTKEQVRSAPERLFSSRIFSWTWLDNSFLIRRKSSVSKRPMSISDWAKSKIWSVNVNWKRIPSTLSCKTSLTFIKIGPFRRVSSLTRVVDRTVW